MESISRADRDTRKLSGLGGLNLADHGPFGDDNLVSFSQLKTPDMEVSSRKGRESQHSCE